MINSAATQKWQNLPSLAVRATVLLMTSMNVSLPEELKAFVDLRLDNDGFSSVSEYVRMLIRQDRENQSREQLRVALIQGLTSGEPVKADASYWKNKQAHLGIS